MNVSKKVLSLVLAAASFLPSAAFAKEPADNDNLAGTILAQVVNELPAKQLAIYTAAANAYLENLRKFRHPEVAEKLAPYFLFNDTNQGDPQGYRDYQALIKKSFKDGTQNQIAAYGAITFLGARQINLSNTTIAKAAPSGGN